MASGSESSGLIFQRDSDEEGLPADSRGRAARSSAPASSSGRFFLLLGAVALFAFAALVCAITGWHHAFTTSREPGSFQVVSLSEAAKHEAAPAASSGAEDQLASLRAQVAELRGEVQELSSRNTELEQQVQTGDHPAQSCTDRCARLNRAGRWRFGSYGHDCPDPVTHNAFCHCSKSMNKTEACEELVPGYRRLRAQRGNRPDNLAPELLASAPQEQPAAAAERVDPAREVPVRSLQAEARPVNAPPRELYSTSDTIGDFCNATGLVAMHGAAATAETAAGAMDPNELNQLETSILSDLSDELENNNVDKAARDIFTFYMCLRWVPDDIFWRLARQEMAANLVHSVVDSKEHIDHAMAELYQKYKYVPLLCTENQDVFGEKDPEDHTYFRTFKKKMTSLSDWLEQHKDDKVVQSLKSVDEIFCHGKNMNDPSCNAGVAFNTWLNGATQKFGDWQWKAETMTDKWEAMYSIFQSFDPAQAKDASWKAALSKWKSKFPFHSFVHKPEGMPPGDSPESDQRFLVCFGKRVASNMHRRPTGHYLMTDQNNIGCHGFWTLPEASDMIHRMVELWKPPTCQLAEMTFVMKKRLLQMYQRMNERLFDALPTLIMDEDLTKEGLLEEHIAGPQPYDPQSMVLDGVKFITGMRVRSTTEIREPVGCKTGSVKELFSSAPKCNLHITTGDYGTVDVETGILKVRWDSKPDLAHDVALSSELTVVPNRWSDKTSIKARTQNIVSGVGHMVDATSQFLDDMSRSRYTSLATLMSNSTSKWVVCPVRFDANYTQLDSQLGVEDAAFKSIQQEAYAKWSGFQGKLPGEVCNGADFIPGEKFPKFQICETAELHADHVEKYTNDDGTLEQFLCPVKQNLPPSEQLQVLLDKRGQCFLHMTKNQQRQYQWPYNGDFPARRQFDRKPNEPNVEYELIKLLQVPSSGEVSYARTCSPEERLAAPRFCRAPQLYNSWPTLEGAAKALVDAAGGSLVISAAALTQSVSEYKETLSQNKNATELLGDTANLVGEQMWDTLTGAGRLLNNAVGSAVSSVQYDLPGRAARNQRLEQEFFQADEPGLLLHMLSFQRPIGANGATSNAKERFQRYVMTMPCRGFDPAMEFAIKKKWSTVALQMIQSAINHGPSHALEVPVVELVLRGEGRLFKRTNDQGDVDTWFTYGGAMQALSTHGKSVPLPDCKWSWRGCHPSDACERAGVSCVPKVSLAPNAWWNLLDRQLVAAVAPALALGKAPVTELFGITMAMYCGKKSQFRDDGLGPEAQPNVLECLKNGVESNARLHASEPWKLYYPDETIVVVVFSALADRQCKVEDTSSYRSELCTSGATEVKDLDAHLTHSDKSSSDGSYQGLHAGAGFPQGTPHEVFLRPEDVLEAAGELSRE